MLKSDHQQRVESFMLLAKQDLPQVPTEPTEAVRLLRAKLIFEEAVETIRALGVVIYIPADGADMHTNVDCAEFEISPMPFDMIETIDGCTDLSVVTIGTLSACGVPDTPFLKLTDENNLAKFAPGHSIREDGKLIKPPGHKPPDIAGLLNKLKALYVTGNWAGYRIPEPMTEVQVACSHERWQNSSPKPRHCLDCGLQMWDAGD